MTSPNLSEEEELYKLGPYHLNGRWLLLYQCVTIFPSQDPERSCPALYSRGLRGPQLEWDDRTATCFERRKRPEEKDVTDAKKQHFHYSSIARVSIHRPTNTLLFCVNCYLFNLDMSAVGDLPSDLCAQCALS